jgi:hypothetical protein
LPEVVRIGPTPALALVILALAFALPGESASGSPVLIQADADCSGSVASIDALAILRQVAVIADAPCAEAADTNCDNAVDSLDALNVLRFVAGLQLDIPEHCPLPGEPLGGVVIVIDPGLQPSRPAIDSMDGGPPQPVEVAVDPNGVTVEFAGNEVVYRPKNEADLQEFLERYDGAVIRDGTTTLPAELADGESKSIEHGYYLIRINPSLASTENLAKDLEDANIQGTVVFSSDQAAQLMAIAAGDPEGRVQVSGLMAPDQSREHPLTASTYIDAETFDYFTSGPGLNIGVVDAWKYLRYQGVVTAAQAIPYQAVRVAVIDGGFALHQTTGVPLNGNVDYFPPGAKPAQYDLDADDATAGGENQILCSGGVVCPWHGSGALGACCAIPNNYYGSAGSGGAYVVPILLKMNNRIYTAADAVRKAELMEADIITMSFSYTCGAWCGWFDGDIGEALDDAGNNGRIPLAAAGNEGVDIGGDEHHRPCEFPKVICVGSISRNKNNLRNYGTPVDIWGVEGINSTVTPESAAKDANNIGMDELYVFDGTSAATPFVAGIVSLMKSLNPSLNYTAARQILQANSNPALDTRVTKGYVNAFASVLATKENIAPYIYDVPVPRSKETFGYSGAIFRVNATDPEPGAYRPEFLTSTVAEFRAQGRLLCSSNSLVYLEGAPGYQCVIQNAPLGTHDVYVIVTDPFGASRTAVVEGVTFVNTPPAAEILEPATGSTYYATQNITFLANVYDPEQCCPFPGGSIVWTSDIQGQIGTGIELKRKLNQGLHTITVTVTDARGVTAQDSITLNILSGAGIPTVDILSPPANSTFGPGEIITFIGQATDPEDGPLTGSSLRWYSDIDGFLGSGEQLTTTVSGNVTCQQPYQPHIITLEATDSDNHKVTDKINIAISIFC